MKYVNKVFIGILFLNTVNPPTGLEAFFELIGLFLLTLIWEFCERLTDLIAFNDLMERRMEKDAIKVLNWLSIKTQGEGLSKE